MKAFIFAFLVASVAARSFDLDTLRLIKEKSLLNTRPIVDDVLLKEKLEHQLPLEKTVLDRTYPVEGKQLLEGFKGIYDYDYNQVNQVLTVEELYQTQLFREYMRLPLFRQYLQYPSFQRYVASTYFQKFWQIPTFRQYFLNPVLFYKYIYPIVTLFQNEYNLPTYNYNNQIYGQETPYNQIYGQETPYNQIYGQETPYNQIYGQETPYNQDVFDDATYYRNKNVFPYVYNNQYGLPTTTSQYWPYTPTTTGTYNYKFLLDKVYRNLYANQPVVGDVTQVKTDVKTLIGDRKVVVEPITGERKVVVEEPKIVDVKVDQKIVPVETFVDTVEKKTVDEVLLLNILLKKNVITPEIFETVIKGHADLFTVLRQILGQYVDITDVTDRDVLLAKVLFHKHIIPQEVYEGLIRHQVSFHTVLRQILNQVDVTYDVTEKDVLLIKVLLKKHIITPEIYQAVTRGQIELFTVLRQIYGHFVDFTDVTNKDHLLVKILLKENVITPEIYQAVTRGQIELFTVLRQILARYDVTDFDFVNRRDVVDPIYNINRFDRFAGNDRYNFDKIYKYNTWYNNQEYPTLRKNIFDRLPLQKVLGNIVA